MSIRSRSNPARWILGIQALVLFVFGGFEVSAFPTEMCPYMAAGRAIAQDLIECPAYTGENPVFEMYTFSLGKHQLMIGLFFLGFAVRGRSRAVIQAGLVYVAVAHLVDWIPPLTWLAGASSSLLPPIGLAAVIFTVLNAVALVLNSRHSEWRASSPPAPA